MQPGKQRGKRGYSLTELLTVVGMVGVISMVALPTFMQIIPQYRIRGAASELAASMRMIRSKAISTRSQWRMVVDPTNDRYWIEQEQVPNSGTWNPISDIGKPLLPGQRWEKDPGADLLPAGGNIIVTFTRSGAANASSVVVGVNNSWVRFNRYTINVEASGNVAVVASKV